MGVAVPVGVAGCPVAEVPVPGKRILGGSSWEVTRLAPPVTLRLPGRDELGAPRAPFHAMTFKDVSLSILFGL